MIEERVGNLFEAVDCDAIGHGVNCMGVMGAGIAVEFRRRYDSMYRAYRNLCTGHPEKRPVPGDVFPWFTPLGTQKAVYNLFTQEKPGANATLPAVRRSVTDMLDHASKNGIERIGLPRIGCGIGGLIWEDVVSIMYDLAGKRQDVDIVLFSL